MKVGSRYFDAKNHSYMVGAHHTPIKDQDTGELFPFIQGCGSSDLFADIPECKAARVPVEIVAYSPSNGFVKVKINGEAYETDSYSLIVLSSGREEEFNAFIERTTGVVTDNHDGAKWVHYPKLSCDR